MLQVKKQLLSALTALLLSQCSGKADTRSSIDAEETGSSDPVPVTGTNLLSYDNATPSCNIARTKSGTAFTSICEPFVKAEVAGKEVLLELDGVDPLLTTIAWESSTFDNRSLDCITDSLHYRYMCSGDFTYSASNVSFQLNLVETVNSEKRSRTAVVSQVEFVSLSPTSATSGASTTMTITGKNFTSALGVKIGTEDCTNVSIVSTTTMTCTSPTLSSGKYALNITDRGQTVWEEVEALTVADAVTLVSIVVMPSSTTLLTGATKQYTATGTYSDSSTQDLSSTVTWSSSATGVATINSSGLLSSSTAGSSVITAVSGSKSGTANVTVSDTASITASITTATCSTVNGTTAALTYNSGTSQWEGSKTSVCGDTVSIILYRSSGQWYAGFKWDGDFSYETNTSSGTQSFPPYSTQTRTTLWTGHSMCGCNSSFTTTFN